MGKCGLKSKVGLEMCSINTSTYVKPHNVLFQTSETHSTALVRWKCLFTRAISSTTDTLISFNRVKSSCLFILVRGLQAAAFYSERVSCTPSLHEGPESGYL